MKNKIPKEHKFNLKISLQHIVGGAFLGLCFVYTLGLDRFNQYIPLFGVVYGAIQGGGHDAFSYFLQLKQLLALPGTNKNPKDDSEDTEEKEDK